MLYKNYDLISTISFCNLPFDNHNNMDFESKSKQEEFFNNIDKITLENCKYIPRNGVIKIKGYVDSFTDYNYGFYNNQKGDVNKTYYFFIVAKNQVSNNAVELTIAIDLFQTYLFNIHFGQCFIEREHTLTDNVGEHTIPEDFELGDYVNAYQNSVDCLRGNVCFFVAVTDYDDNAIGGMYGRIYSGFKLRYFTFENYNDITIFIQDLCVQGKGDCIAFIFTFPQEFLEESIQDTLSSGDYIDNCINVLTKMISFNRMNRFIFNGEEYTPKNKKLLTHPYQFITVYNSSGANVVLKYELFNDVGINFVLQTTLTQNPTFSLVPLNYNNLERDYQNSIEQQGYGLCSWNNDNYANWYANNQNSIRSQSANALNSYKANNTISGNNYNTNAMNNTESAVQSSINSLTSVLGSALSLNIGGALASGVSGANNTYFNYSKANRSNSNDLENSMLMNKVNYQNQINSIMASVKDSQVQPNTCKGDTSSSGLDIARGSNTFYLSNTCIKPEYAKIIDLYFQMYGYKVNRIGFPQFKSRQHWNYVKTLGCKIISKIPQEDKQALEQMFDEGFTVWHDLPSFYKYDVDNNVKG